MNTFENWIVKMKGIEQYFDSGAFQRDIQVVAAHEMAQQIRERVRDTGATYQGGQFKGYSTKTTLVGAKSFIKKGAWDQVFAQAKSNKDKNAAIHWITIKSGDKRHHLIVLPGGYKRIRELEGVQTTHKGFYRSGEMWRSFDVKKESIGQNKLIIGGTKEEPQNKINWNSAREKLPITFASQFEIQRYTKRIQDAINKKFNDSLNNR